MNSPHGLKNHQVEDVNDRNLARLYAYDLLRRLFIEEPTVELMNYLKEDQFQTFSQIDASAALQNALQHLQTYLHAHRFKARCDAFEDLHWDFTRLFIGPDAPCAPPWESFYVREDQFLFQETTKSIEAIYETHGFVLDEGEVEAADHIGLELDFLYQLNVRACDLLQTPRVDTAALEHLRQLQLEFLQTHVGAFSSLLAENMFNHAQTDFYKWLGIVLNEFLIADSNKIKQHEKEVCNK